jgi:AraC family transcriptional regulator
MPSAPAFRNKQTGQETPFLAGSRSLLIETKPCPWQHIRIDLRYTPAYENPEIISSSHVFALKVDFEQSRSEWRQRGNWREHTFSQGDLGIHPAGLIDKMRSDCSREGLIAQLDHEAVVQTCAGFEVPSEFEFETLLPVRDELIAACLQSLLHEARTGYTCGELYGDSIAATLAAHYLLKYGKRKINVRETHGGLPKETLKSVLEFIDANASQRLRLSELAAIAHLSPYHFSRLFKVSTNLSPYQYLMRTRVKMARRLMNKGDMSLKEISRNVGFYDSSHFSRVFKRVTGVKTTEIIRHVDDE